MQETRDFIEFDAETIESGYKNCRQSARTWFPGFSWIIGNLPREKQRAIETIVHHSVHTLKLLDLESNDGLSLDIWHHVRDDLSDAFLDNYTSPELAALIATARKYNIPKQFLFDPISGVDLWIRNRKFETFEELATFASNVGGSPLAATISVMGFIKPGFETAAIECGKGILLTQILANCVNDIKAHKVFLAQHDLSHSDDLLHRLKLRQNGKQLKYLIRTYCARIEKIFYNGGKLIPFLDFDAKRSITSLLAIHWRMLMRMKTDPDSVLDEKGVLTKRDKFSLKSRHLLGMEGHIPIIPDDHGH